MRLNVDLRLDFDFAETKEVHYRVCPTFQESTTMNKNEILIRLSESEMTKVGKEEFAQQSLPQKVFSAIWEVESEVNNGGFSQYFLNDSAESASFVVAALEQIGAPSTASICNRAMVTAFLDGLPQTVEAIRSIAGDFSEEILEKLEPLDQEFLSYPHNPTDLLFAYVNAHPEEFGALPTPDDA
jgi:uncharacterized protein DUF4375